MEPSSWTLEAVRGAADLTRGTEGVGRRELAVVPGKTKKMPREVEKVRSGGPLMGKVRVSLRGGSRDTVPLRNKNVVSTSKNGIGHTVKGDAWERPWNEIKTIH